MRVALYSRVSSDKQDMDLSIGAQVKALKDYAAKHGYEVVREFVDEGLSGRTASRPAFREMVALAKAKPAPFEAILVWKLNRFARNRTDSITYKALLRAKGVEVISINEPFEDTPSGHLFEGIIETLDEFYSANMGQDIKRGLRENASRGFFNGSRIPYGFRKVDVHDGTKIRHKLEPEDSAAAQTVRRMFEMSLNNAGCKQIAVTLNSEGFRTSKGERWGRTTVYKVLTNEAYAGTLVFDKQPGHPAFNNESPVRVENAWPAIIDKTTFILVQKKLADNSPKIVHPRTVPSSYLLSGILFCSCGRALTGHSAKSGKHFYYVCSRSMKQGKDACSSRMIPKDKLEQRVIQQIKEKVLTNENLEELVKLVNEDLHSASAGLSDRMQLIEVELTDTHARLSRLYDALETGKLGLEELAPRIKELKNREDDLSKARLQIEAEMITCGVQDVKLATVQAYASDLRNILEESDFTDRKAFLRSFIKKIVVYGERVVVTYKLPQRTPGVSNEIEEVLPIDNVGGAEGGRTPYLFNAIESLSQLSYSPNSQLYQNIP